MALPELYRAHPDRLHTSSDGQKFEVAVDSLNANSSFKSFGHRRGVSPYPFIDERHFHFHSMVISSAEREATYVIDGLMHNDGVKSDIHSTDPHRYSEAVRAGSVVTWRQLNLHGEFDFSDEKLQDSSGLPLPQNLSLGPLAR